MLNLRVSIPALVGLFIVSAGCSNPRDFNEDKAKSILESKPVNLDGEQVSLTPGQLDCGVREDLWESPVQVSTGSSARLSATGRNLKFNDNVLIEPGNRFPYVQIKGDFPLQVDAVVAIRNGADSETKIVDVKVGIKVDHTCFQTPLPIMGVKKGNFRDDTPPAFQFSLHEDGWHFEKLVH